MQAEPRNWESMEFPHAQRTGVIGRPASPRQIGEHVAVTISGDDDKSAVGATTGRPANDNEKGTPWPLYDEYVAERLGKDAYANSKHWNTAMWIDGIYNMAMLPDRSLGPLHWFSSGADFASEEIDGYSATHVIPPEVVSVLNLLDGVERIRRKRRGYELVGTHETSADRDPRAPTGVEVRSDASKKLRMLQVGMRGLWTPVKQAIVDHTELWKIGITQGVSRAMAPTAGRQRVLDGLGLAADIRQDISRWEASLPPHC
jgi:hypothetical protein